MSAPHLILNDQPIAGLTDNDKDNIALYVASKSSISRVRTRGVFHFGKKTGDYRSTRFDSNSDSPKVKFQRMSVVSKTERYILRSLDGGSVADGKCYDLLCKPQDWGTAPGGGWMTNTAPVQVLVFDSDLASSGESYIIDPLCIALTEGTSTERAHVKLESTFAGAPTEDLRMYPSGWCGFDFPENKDFDASCFQGRQPRLPLWIHLDEKSRDTNGQPLPDTVLAGGKSRLEILFD